MLVAGRHLGRNACCTGLLHGSRSTVVKGVRKLEARLWFLNRG